MASGSRVPYRDLYNKLNNDDLNYLIKHLKSYLFEDVDFDLNLMYEKAYKMVCFFIKLKLINLGT